MPLSTKEKPITMDEVILKTKKTVRKNKKLLISSAIVFLSIFIYNKFK